MTGNELDRQVRAELGTLSKDNAARVARHLVMTFQLLDENPELALAHAQAAQRRAGRVGLVREAAGLAAYRAGAFDLALRELRAARRLTGSQVHLPVMADCERGLGRPERALALATSGEARTLDRAGQLEMLIVAAGARQDLGQHDAAVVMLQVPELDLPSRASHARLLSAYADALDAAGRHEEAVEWLQKAAVVDVEGETGAAERLGHVEQEPITDLLEDDDMDDETPAGQGEVAVPHVDADADRAEVNPDEPEVNPDEPEVNPDEPEVDADEPEVDEDSAEGDPAEVDAGAAPDQGDDPDESDADPDPDQGDGVGDELRGSSAPPGGVADPLDAHPARADVGGLGEDGTDDETRNGTAT